MGNSGNTTVVGRAERCPHSFCEENASRPTHAAQQAAPDWACMHAELCRHHALLALLPASDVCLSICLTSPLYVLPRMPTTPMVFSSTSSRASSGVMLYRPSSSGTYCRGHGTARHSTAYVLLQSLMFALT
jgi:hypothetical protein